MLQAGHVGLRASFCALYKRMVSRASVSTPPCCFMSYIRSSVLSTVDRSLCFKTSPTLPLLLPSPCCPGPSAGTGSNSPSKSPSPTAEALPAAVAALKIRGKHWPSILCVQAQAVNFRQLESALYCTIKIARGLVVFFNKPSSNFVHLTPASEAVPVCETDSGEGGLGQGFCSTQLLGMHLNQSLLCSAAMVLSTGVFF